MNFSSYQSNIVSLMRSHMDGNYRGRQSHVLICAEVLNQAHKMHLNMRLSYLDLEIDELIPLRISVFLNDFGAKLKQRKCHCI